MPAIGIQSDAELKRAVVIDGGSHIQLLQDLVPVEPDLVESRAVALPPRLDDHLVPDAGAHRGQVLVRGDGARAIGLAVLPADDARGQLVAQEPEHGRGHVVVAATVRARPLGFELRDVVGLRGELPAFGKAEHETVETLVATLVALVTAELGVVAAAV